MLNELGEVQNVSSRFPSVVWDGMSIEQRPMAMRSPNGSEWVQNVREIQSAQQYALDITSMFDKPEIILSASTTLTTLGRMYNCSPGFPAPMIINLPSLVVGKLIGIRVDNTGVLVTINSTSNIGYTITGVGQTTRVLQSNEVVILLGTSTGWVKVGGVTRPFAKQIELVSYTLLAALSGTVIFNLFTYSTLGFAGVTVNPGRPGLYTYTLSGTLTASATTTVTFAVNGRKLTVVILANTTSTFIFNTSTVFTSTSAIPLNYTSTADVTATLSVIFTEVPQW